jgi:small-conductance mechanosensitive channel
MDTIIHISSRGSLQLTHELGGYIQQMRSCAPTENTINTRIIQLNLSATP